MHSNNRKHEHDAVLAGQSINAGNENILDDASEDSASRVPIEASHRNQVSSTNSGFYKFRS